MAAKASEATPPGSLAWHPLERGRLLSENWAVSPVPSEKKCRWAHENNINVKCLKYASLSPKPCQRVGFQPVFTSNSSVILCLTRALKFSHSKNIISVFTFLLSSFISEVTEQMHFIPVQHSGERGLLISNLPFQVSCCCAVVGSFPCTQVSGCIFSTIKPRLFHLPDSNTGEKSCLDNFTKTFGTFITKNLYSVFQPFFFFFLI